MKPLTLWIIRTALMVQFLGVLAVPALLAAAESGQEIGVAGWLGAASAERAEAESIVEQAREELLTVNAR